MKVVILCGGQSTRIRDVAEDLPKPMIPIGGRPILWHIMKYYAQSGFNEFVLCLGYKGQVIRDFFLNYEAHTKDFTLTLGAREKAIHFHSDHAESGWKITFAETGLQAMTGARVYRIRKYLENEPHFFLTYGDGVGNVDLKRLLAFHQEQGKIMTVSAVRPPGRYGELMGDSSHRVTEFNEKPQATGGRISGGFFVCRSEIFEYLSNSDDLVLEESPMRQLVQDGQMMMFDHDGFWQPMDTYRDYLLLSRLWEQGKAPWAVWT